MYIYVYVHVYVCVIASVCGCACKCECVCGPDFTYPALEISHQAFGKRVLLVYKSPYKV